MGAEWTNQSHARALTCAVGEPRIPAKGSDGLTTLGRRNGPWWWDDWRAWSEETEISQSSRSGSKAIWGVRRIFGDLKICALELLVERPFDKKTVWICTLGASLLRCWGLAFCISMPHVHHLHSSSFTMYNDHSMTMGICPIYFWIGSDGWTALGISLGRFGRGGIPLMLLQRGHKLNVSEDALATEGTTAHSSSTVLSISQQQHRSRATALRMPTAKLTRCFCFWKPFSLFQKVLPSHGMH